MQTRLLVDGLTPVFDFLDGIIRDYGLNIFVGFVYVLIPFTAWALSGGLRWKLLRGKSMRQVPPVIVIHLPVGRPTPPTESYNPFPPLCEPPDGVPDDG